MFNPLFQILEMWLLIIWLHSGLECTISKIFFPSGVGGGGCWGDPMATIHHLKASYFHPQLLNRHHKDWGTMLWVVLWNHRAVASFWVLTPTPGAEALCGFPSHDACTESIFKRPCFHHSLLSSGSAASCGLFKRTVGRDNPEGRSCLLWLGEEKTGNVTATLTSNICKNVL